jgi:hypothetical protein
MPRIVIIGDSWGVPNYPPANSLTHIGDPPETHTEFLLRNLGYDVVNFSKNGRGNINSISEALIYSRENTVDWIFWFHTEMLRDSYLVNLESYTINELTETLAEIIYKKFEELRILSGAKTIVVGAQAPILESFHKYTFADNIKKDWRGELLGIDFPTIHSLCTPHLIESDRCVNSMSEKMRLLDHHEMILNSMKISDLFPDNAHPGKQCHADLTTWIDGIIRHN